MRPLPHLRLLPAILLAGMTLCAATAGAHNLFLIVERTEDGPDRIDVVFEHAPFPGKGGYYRPFLERGKIRVREIDGTETETTGSRAVVQTCNWGIYKGRMVYFHGKFLDVTSADDLAQLASTPELPLDIVPSWNGSTLEVTVQFEGTPLPNTKVWIWSPGSKPSTVETDDEGILRRENPAEGLHFFAALHVIDGPTGEFQGESYEGIMHGTTVGLRLPLE